MNKTADIKIGHVIPAIKRTASSVASGAFDAFGCSEVAITVLRGVLNVNAKQVLRVRHASASTADYASATAFSTPLIASSTAGSSTAALGPMRIDMSGKGRYLICLLSNVTQSANTGVLAIGMGNERTASTQASFVSLNGVTSAPNNP